jgi:hypothetical protein
MIDLVRPRRLFAVTFVCSGVVFGVAILAGNGRAQAGAAATYRCSAPDKQFIGTVSSNLAQLSYWSDALVSHDVEPDVVVKQARDEAAQVGATQPQDRTLHATRDLLSSMFVEYSKAVSVTARGHGGHTHMQNAWRLAHSVHDLLAGAKDGLGAQGCDITPLLDS